MDEAGFALRRTKWQDLSNVVVGEDNESNDSDSDDDMIDLVPIELRQFSAEDTGFEYQLQRCASIDASMDVEEMDLTEESISKMLTAIDEMQEKIGMQIKDTSSSMEGYVDWDAECYVDWDASVPETKIAKFEFVPQFVNGISPPENWRYTVGGIFNSIQNKHYILVNNSRDHRDTLRKRVLNAAQLMSVDKNVSSRKYSWYDYVEHTPPLYTERC